MRVVRASLIAILSFSLLAALAPAVGASSGSVSGTRKQFGVTQYFVVRYNYQPCGTGTPGKGHTAYKITSASAQWTRDSLDLLVRSSPPGKVGINALKCDRTYLTWSSNLTFTSGDIQFGCGGNAYTTCLKTFSWTSAPYGYRNGEWEQAGGWLKGTIYRKSTGATLGSICGLAAIFGSLVCG